MEGKTVIVEWDFPTLNDFISATRKTRGRWSGGNEMKQRDQHVIALYIRKYIKGKLKWPISLDYVYYADNTRKDKDNIASYFTKVFQDALVVTGKIPDDGWKYITGWTNDFYVDRKCPRVEVRIHESNGAL